MLWLKKYIKKGGEINRMNITELTKTIVSSQEENSSPISAKEAKEVLITILKELAAMEDKEFQKFIKKYRL